MGGEGGVSGEVTRRWPSGGLRIRGYMYKSVVPTHVMTLVVRPSYIPGITTFYPLLKCAETMNGGITITENFLKYEPVCLQQFQLSDS